jgi:hypothetical protein
MNITQLTTLYSGDRPCEPENLALRGMQDDDEFNVLKGPLPQIKTKKTKVYSTRQRHTVTDLGTWLWATSLFSYFAKPWSAKEMSLAIWSPTITGSSLNCVHRQLFSLRIRRQVMDLLRLSPLLQLLPLRNLNHPLHPRLQAAGGN